MRLLTERRSGKLHCLKCVSPHGSVAEALEHFRRRHGITDLHVNGEGVYASFEFRNGVTGGAILSMRIVRDGQCLRHFTGEEPIAGARALCGAVAEGIELREVDRTCEACSQILHEVKA